MSMFMVFLFTVVCLCVALVGGLYFFFFFKQKTAYELRISDWSSDVCSSDLCSQDFLGDLAVFRNGAVGLQDWQDGFERVAVDLCHALHFLRPCVFQIGRASCRERVCQYV